MGDPGRNGHHGETQSLKQGAAPPGGGSANLEGGSYGLSTTPSKPYVGEERTL